MTAHLQRGSALYRHAELLPITSNCLVESGIMLGFFTALVGMCRAIALIIAFALPLYSSVASAETSVCGPPPVVADEKLKGEIEGQAELVLKFLGNARLSGNIQKARKDVFSNYPNADKLRTDTFFQYQFCLLLMKDDSLNDKQKREELKKMQREFFKPVSVRDQQSGSNRYWFAIVGVGFTCDIDLPVSKRLSMVPSEDDLKIELRPMVALSINEALHYTTLFYRGDVMKIYSCNIDGTDYILETTKRSEYTNENGHRCAKFSYSSNHPFDGGSIKRENLCLSASGDLYSIEN